MTDIRLFEDVVAMELAAARIDHALDLDPRLAIQWRHMRAVSEAVNSIAMEDVRISENELLLRIAFNGIKGADSPALEDALDVLKFLHAPGETPIEVMGRIERQARREDPESVPVLDDPEIREKVFRQIRGRLPLWEALKVSQDLALLTRRASPVAERMIFMAAESMARRKQGRETPGHIRSEENRLRGLGGSITARWIATPATALSRAGSSMWSSSSDRGARRLIDALSRDLERGLGQVITIRKWLKQVDAVHEGRRSDAGAIHVAAAFTREPVLTSARAAGLAGISVKQALAALAELEETGLIKELTGRRTARIWAPPDLAGHISRFHIAPSDLPRSHRSRREIRDEANAANAELAGIISEIDEALKGTDKILDRIGVARPIVGEIDEE